MAALKAEVWPFMIPYTPRDDLPSLVQPVRPSLKEIYGDLYQLTE